MSGLSGDIWARLSETPPRGDELTARVALPDLTHRLLAALDSERHRHLLIVLQSGDADLRDAQSRGLWVSTNDLVVSGQAPSRYLDILCNDAAGHEAFDVIGVELGQRLASAGARPAECVSRVLAKWRRFWGQVPRDALSREQQVGLFAEVWFLSYWLIPHVGASEAVLRWRGPSGSRHDFEWPGRSIEVKATTSARGAIHRINGIEQLAPPETGDLLLFSMRLHEERGATSSLPAVIESCRSALASDETAVSGFESALARAGYSPIHEDEYLLLTLRVVEQALYRVEADFPRLTPEQLGGVPSGIESVDYEINLSGFERLIVARAPALAVVRSTR